MGQLEDLRAELEVGHPGTGPYNADDAIAAQEINVVNRQRNRPQMTGDEIFAATDGAQFDALTPEDRQLWMSFCGRDILDPFGAANVAFVVGTFGAGTATPTALIAARRENVSRADELGLGSVRTGTVSQARGL